MYTLNILGINISTYRFCILFGIISSNMIASLIARRRKLNYDTVFVLETYGILGAIIGAKLGNFIEVNGIQGIGNFSVYGLIESGYSYYGGMFLGLLLAYAASQWHRLDLATYSSNFIFLIPLVHAICKCGCFFAGCCYGIPYDGIMSVSYEIGGEAPASIGLFPVQLLEALILLLTSGYFYVAGRRTKRNLIPVYMITYGITRLFVEFLRYHTDGRMTSIAQIWSILSLCIGIILLNKESFLRRRKG